MTLHVQVSIAIYYQLYKLTSQVSLVTALIEQDNFLYLSSFMDKYFSGNAFKFLIFFNLLTFNKIVLNLAGSRERSESQRHLFQIQEYVGNERKRLGNRKKDVIISRLRIGHTALNHSLYKIGKHESGKCDKCGEFEQ